MVALITSGLRENNKTGTDHGFSGQIYGLKNISGSDHGFILFIRHVSQG